MMEKSGRSKLNKNFVDDFIDDSYDKIMHTDAEKLPCSIAEEGVLTDHLYLNSFSKEKPLESDNKSINSRSYINVDAPEFENKHLVRFSPVEVFFPGCDKLPNAERRQIQSNRCSSGNVNAYVDFERIKTDTKRAKKGSLQTSKQAPDTSENLQMQCSGMAVVDEDKIAVVTKTGEILLFKNTGCLAFLEAFLETFEDVTSVSTKEIAASCAFCIKFFEVQDGAIKELEEKCIDFQFSGETTVHALHFVNNVFIITCNIQTCLLSAPPIKMIDRKGNVLKHFVIPTIHSPRHVSSTDEGKIIFITDQALKKVTAIDDSGSIKWEVTMDHVPHYVSVYQEKSVLVSCERELELKRFSLTGKPLPPVETRLGPNSAPFLVSYFSKNDTLYFCSEIFNHCDREFLNSLKPKKSQLQKFKDVFMK